jgi:hypothetical protein
MTCMSREEELVRIVIYSIVRKEDLHEQRGRAGAILRKEDLHEQRGRAGVIVRKEHL